MLSYAQGENKNPPVYLQSLFRLYVNCANSNRREMFRVPTGRTNFQKAIFENVLDKIH